MPAPPTEDGDQREGQDLSADPELREAEVEFLSETRLDQEEAVRDAAALAMRTRALADVAFELMSRGDLVSVSVGDRSFTGRIIYSAGDLMTVKTAEPTVDFNLGAAV